MKDDRQIFLLTARSLPTRMLFPSYPNYPNTPAKSSTKTGDADLMRPSTLSAPQMLRGTVSSAGFR